MADDDRHGPPRKRARLNSNSDVTTPRQRERENNHGSDEDEHGHQRQPPAAAAAMTTLAAHSDRDRASLFFRSFLDRMASSPIFQFASSPQQAPPPMAIPPTSAAMRDVAHAIVSVSDGDVRMPSPHNDDANATTTIIPSPERTSSDHPHGDEADDVDDAHERGGHEEEEQEEDVATTIQDAAANHEESNTDDEDLQQLSMVMCDRLMDDDTLALAQSYFQSDVSFEDIHHVVFHQTKEQKGELVGKLLTLIQKTPHGDETIAQLVKAEDEAGLTLLMISVRHGMLDLCLTLVDAGADVNQCSEKRPVALLLAAQKGLEDATRFLLQHGANDESKNMALIPAAHFGHLGVVRVLLEFGADENYSNKKGTTPLMRAAQEGRDEVVQFLIDKNAVAYAANNEGMTALMLAAQRGHATIATILIHAGSDVNTQTRQGSTALLLAAKRGHTEAVEALMAAGADIFLKDDRHKTAAETAHRRGHVELFLKITVSNQICLMREALRRERYAELMRISHLYVLSRATIVPSLKSPERQHLNALLDRTMRLPRPLLQTVALFLPMCNVWDRQLKYLIYEAPFLPSRVVQHGIRILDDILVSVVLDMRSSLDSFRRSNPHLRGRHLALLRDNVEFRDIFTEESHLALPPELLAKLRRMADIQGALASYAAGVAIQFGVEVAQDVVALVSDMLAWDGARKRAAFDVDDMDVLDPHTTTDSILRIKKEEPSI